MMVTASGQEKARLGATLLAQWLLLGTVLADYFMLYGADWNRILVGILLVIAVSLVATLLYSEIVYDGVQFADLNLKRPSDRSVNTLIMVLSAVDIVGLFVLVRWTVAPEAFFPLFLTLLTIVIILRAPKRWITGLIIAVAMAYGAALYLPEAPIPSSLKIVHHDGAHGLTLVCCLLVIWLEQRRMTRAGYE